MGHITRVHGPPPLEPSARPEGPVELATGGERPPSLYLLPAALQTIQEHIGWGQVTEANVMEQGGLLIGRAYLDAETSEPFAVVEQVLEAHTASSTAASIALTHDTWADLLARFDQLPPPAAGPPWRIVGWYHTHPNSIPVFMSGTDRRTQQDFFPGRDHFALVLNPQRQQWQAFRGAECVECVAVALRAPETARVPRDAEAAPDTVTSTSPPRGERVAPRRLRRSRGRMCRRAALLLLAAALAWTLYRVVAWIRRPEPAGRPIGEGDQWD